MWRPRDRTAHQTPRILFRYVLPNAMGPIIVNTTMSISDMILSAAGLSFIGMGIQPPSPEWGALLSNAQTYLFTAPYMLVFPGIFIILFFPGIQPGG